MGRTLSAAVQGWLYFGWLYVERPRVAGWERGKGLGTELVGRIESIAVERGIPGARLSTASWQAREFSRRRGYREYVQVDTTADDAPGGKKRVEHLMKKDLTSSS